ncbi:hypothetical protein SH668x_001385 [Planctomicrobium sp. SH668]|uniref:hypothetical protein n=1 Tax=Planctomicrobium sp. SH668 TaxID=3448126 RepID=UPI003F5C76CC
MKKLNLFVAMLVCGAVVVLATSKNAEARPQYLKALTEKYEKVAEKANELKCGVCHGEGGKNKKTVSDYGKALGSALGEKNVKGEEALAKALDKAAEGDAGDGKTFGDLLKEGTLPAAAK